jgi:hypothetical protein
VPLLQQWLADESSAQAQDKPALTLFFLHPW